MNPPLDRLDTILASSPRHLSPSIIAATPRFAEISAMLVSRDPKASCNNCVKLNRGCTFDCWSLSCRECDLSLTEGCTFASLREFQDFAAADDAIASDKIALAVDYGAIVTLERYHALYPIVPAYFEATSVTHSFKTLTAFRNILDSLNPKAVAALLDLGLVFGLSPELQNALLARMICHNRYCPASDRVSLIGPSPNISWSEVSEAPFGSASSLSTLAGLLDSSMDMPAL
ncbi:hypothetical protein C8R46DRAFT_1236294 [Mycena filopes]|nr:hypothetical protein C8R46DRAFT_1236294 [Mycena filopes]